MLRLRISKTLTNSVVRGAITQGDRSHKGSMVYFGSGSGGTWIGWRRWRDVVPFVASIAFIFTAYFGGEFYENKQKFRRHQSIEKDIEREMWRAKELGLSTAPKDGEAPKTVDDDGFAEKYLTDAKAKRSQSWW